MKTLLRWSNAVALAAVAVLILILYGPDGNWVPAAVVALVLLAGAWFTSPLTGANEMSWAALRGRQDGHKPDANQPEANPPVVIFWRPGCVFCIRLRTSLGRSAKGAQWVNIWRDAEAAAFVRDHNGGNETVPTVMFGADVVTNPEPACVRRALAAR